MVDKTCSDIKHLITTRKTKLMAGTCIAYKDDLVVNYKLQTYLLFETSPFDYKFNQLMFVFSECKLQYKYISLSWQNIQIFRIGKF